MIFESTIALLREYTYMEVSGSLRWKIFREIILSSRSDRRLWLLHRYYNFRIIFDSSLHIIDRISDFFQMEDFHRHQYDTTWVSQMWFEKYICSDQDRDRSLHHHVLSIVRVVSSEIHLISYNRRRKCENYQSYSLEVSDYFVKYKISRLHLILIR